MPDIPINDVPDALLVKARKEAASMSVFCHGHPLVGLRPRLAAHGVVTARDLRRIPSESRVRVTGIRVIVHTPPTRSGHRVMFITMEDETGLLDVVAFPKAQKDGARSILTSEVITVEGILQRQGKDGRSMSIVMEKVIPSLTGPLSMFLLTSPAGRASTGKRNTTRRPPFRGKSRETLYDNQCNQ